MSHHGKRHLSRDLRFRKIIESSTPLRRINSDGDVYAALLRTIVYQQLSGKAAATIHGRFLDLFPDRYPDPSQLSHLTSDELRAVGLSRQKAGYLQNVASHWETHGWMANAWGKFPDDQVIELLTQIKGVGTWSAQMILMFTLRRPDIFPRDDLGIRNAMVKRYRLRSQGKALTQRMTQIAEAWRPYRTLACRYLWQWHDT